jgi:N-methylhydantoinase A
MSHIISIDTGGTFTDVVVMGPDRKPVIGKALTTHERVFSGMQGAITAAAAEMNMTLGALLADTELLVYGTTRATNAIVTKRVAKTAFVTTAGFPDTLVLKEAGKVHPHDFRTPYSDPYIPRRHTFEVVERMSSEGTVSIPFDEAQAREVIARIVAQRFEAIAVCFLWSVANGAHEQAFARLLDEMAPGIPYTISHELIPIVREYRRASATAIDASLKPLMQQHLRQLEADLRTAGYRGEILVSTTSGGCTNIDAVIAKPIYTIGSGPAMAPISSRAYAQQEDYGDNVIVCDTGGTTFDVGLVRDGRLTFTRDTWLGPRYIGDLVAISAVDMRSVGAGGGSIAWIDQAGLMHVGPQSAGSEPGPACYGRGGTKPTVSDAAVVLGYFDPDYFLGGRMQLDVTAARGAIESVSSKIGLTIEECAYRILTLASELMIRAIGDITINEGVNPRESTIVAGGGAAGLNIMLIAKELGCDRVILPKTASALSAAGMQYANIVSEEAASLVTSTNGFDFEGVAAVFAALQAKLDAFAAGLGHDGTGYRIEFIAEARYVGQIWELDTPVLPSGLTTASDVEALAEEFHRVHERVFAVRDEGSAVEFINWKARLSIPLGAAPVPEPTIAPKDIDAVLRGSAASRNCFFGQATPIVTPIYKPSDMTPGLRVQGPAIIEESTTTLVVYPGMHATMSGAGNYLLEI